ncbi:(2,3-dihydroxybenzoyl)adenylate synthase [Variovorax sp. Sphag1AA]|uniref:(2,3-dihydroxybenzoyl)adenylate synthase n=1 Tax=Variovorax sp. Sphag1AA TaxID=2587027 RepID=UPI00161C18E0|nr:AMP-binding protein [Variovorax sp. Sphag1AA]MBB3177626.1 2,3-dihydroxybenzoate-AMP ligase [Variovorax sp. Sphag1AA]
MLDGCVPWPAEAADKFRRLGLWEDITVAEMVERTMRATPGKTALIFNERRISYAELVRSSKRLAAALLDLGLKPRDRVVMQLPNVPEFVIAYLALNWLGAIPVMALRAHRHNEVRHFIRASGATAYLIPDVAGNFDYRSMAAEMAAEFPHLRHVIVAGEPAPGQRALEPLIDGGTADDDAIAARLQAIRPAPDDVSTMLLSGGTTSVSKLIPRTHNDYVLNARLCAQAAGFDRDTVFMAILPLGHNYNLASPGILGTFHAGGTVVIAASTDIESTFASVERERVSVIASVVPLISNWLNSDVPKRFDLSSLKVVQNGGARLAPELRTRLRDQFGCTPQEIYGTAEGLINMTRLDDPEALLLESSGAPVSEHDEIKVLDDNDHEVPDGEPGELVTRGPYTIRGYYNAPAKNAEAFTPDGFYRMGDIVRKRGRHVFTEGRRKDLINRGGEKISCDEIENLIFGMPQVKVVALVGLPDPVFGEKACACVILQPGATLGFDELVTYLRQQKIASFKLPERLEIMTEFPVSPVGKILKRELRERLTAQGGA